LRDASDASDLRGRIGLAYSDLPWLSVPIGGIVELPTNLTGVTEPSTGSALYRFAKLTAGLTGSGAYNNGVLGSESVSGSAPLVQATASVTLSGSPMSGQTIRLLNSEGRFLRPGTSSGTVRNDQMQVITGRIILSDTSWSTNTGALISVSSTPGDRAVGTGNSGTDINFNSANSSNARTGVDTYPKHLEMTYYMRVK
jgi:hypothetical protein